MQKLRLFLGIPLTDTVREVLKKSVRNIPGKIVPARNWHLTLHFLGMITEDKIPLLEKILVENLEEEAFQISLSRFGGFPTVERARVLWLGPREGFEKLLNMGTKLGEALKANGFHVDERPLIPHLTLSRFGRPKDVTEWISEIHLKELILPISEIVLYQSILGEHGSHYQKLFSVQLK